MPDRTAIPVDFVAREPAVGAVPGPLDDWLRSLWSPPAVLRRLPESYFGLIDAAGRQSADWRAMSEHELSQAIGRMRVELRRLPGDDAVLASCLALLAEVCHRATRLMPFREQWLGALLIHHGYVAEMATGEGKTLTVMIAAAMRALSGNQVHVVTVNDYLAVRDFEAARPFLRRLGLDGGLIAAGVPESQRRAAYACDLIFCSNKELVFDFLRDRHAHGPEPLGLRQHATWLGGGVNRVVRRFQFAIIDEADSVLLDEAMTPLVLSAGNVSAYFDGDVAVRVLELARQMTSGIDFQVEHATRRLWLTAAGANRTCSGLDLRSVSLDVDRVKLDLVNKGLYALHLLERDQDYIVHEGRIHIVDEGTGRILTDRSWEEGLHQMVEVKEGLQVTEVRQSVGRITFQQFFRRYHTLAGTTGTAREVAAELQAHYRLRVASVPLHSPSRRRIAAPRVLVDREAQVGFIVRRIAELLAQGRPVLVGTRSVAESESLAASLREAGIPCALLNARHVAEEAAIVAEAGQAGRVTVATNMAGRGTDIRLSEAVQENGGLHVILTELHAAQRIDRQLEGRSARQGDPGSFEMILRLEPGSVLGGLDAGLLWLARFSPTGRWPDDGIGRLPSLALLARRMLQRWNERRDAGRRRRMVRAEQSGRQLIDY